MIHYFHCDICNEDKSFNSDFTTGYGKTRDGKTICYACCAKRDMNDMLETGRARLYLNSDNGKNYTVSNWPGSLKLPVKSMSKGKHNIAKVRYDVWFSVYNQEWHGVQYGNNTQICHCKKVKS